jgi:hypothetical protein
MLQWLYTYISSAYSKCFICFRRMLQVYHLDVAKVDLNVTYIYAIQVFSYICCKCFHLHVAMFAMATHVFFKFSIVFCKCFRCMLQVFQLFWTYVASVLSECCKSRSDVAHVE